MVLAVEPRPGPVRDLRVESMGAGYCSVRFRAMGTGCRIEFRAPSEATGRLFRERALAWLNDFESKYSRFLPDSMISRLNDAAGAAWIAIDEELEGIFALCDWFHWVTRGLFDPSSLPLLRLWDYARRDPRVPRDDEVDAARGLTGWRRVQRAPGRAFLPEAGMAVDIGGIGKEYAVDRVIGMAAGLGVRDALVDFGGDLRVLGSPPEGGPWRIGLENHREPGTCWGGVALADKAVATSGDYLRGFTVNGRRYGHILDPRTGRPAANGCRCVSVVAPTCTEAGIYATTALILGVDEGLQLLESGGQLAGAIWSDTGGVKSGRYAKYEIGSSV